MIAFTDMLPEKTCLLELFAREKRPLIVGWGGGIDHFVQFSFSRKT
jgi:hypothetical protein